MFSGNHKLVFSHAGFSQVKEYRYWDAKNRGVDFAGFKEDLEVMEKYMQLNWSALVMLYCNSLSHTSRSVLMYTPHTHTHTHVLTHTHTHIHTHTHTHAHTHTHTH